MIWGLARQMQGIVWVSGWLIVAPGSFAAGMEGSVPAHADPLDEAGPNEAEAQFAMGNFLYARGEYTNAFTWYELSAEQGHRAAQVSLATCYILGRGVEKNVAQAAHWSARARGEFATVTAPPPAPRMVKVPVLEEPVKPAAPPPALGPAQMRPTPRGLERIAPELESVELQMQQYGDAPSFDLKP